MAGLNPLDAMATVGAAAINYASTKQQSKAMQEEGQKNRDFQLEMANKQRAEALEDRAHAESYNSPLMERLRRESAGLGPVDDYSTPGTPAQGLAPDYAEATKGSGDALVTAAQLGASSPMVMMQGALEAAKTTAQIMKDRSEAAESLQSGRLKAITAELNELTLQDDVAAKRLQNDLTFQKTQNLIQEFQNLIESGKLTRAQRKKAEVDFNVAVQTQEFKIEIARQEAEQSKIKTKLDEMQLNEVMPKQLKLLDAEISRANAAAYLSSSQARRIERLLPFEEKQLQEAVTLLGIAVKSGTIDYDESVVKHNVFMSHIPEYEASLMSEYKLSREEANWYAIRQVGDLVARAASTAVMGFGIGKYFAAPKAFAPVANGIKNAGLALPGSTAYEGLARGLGSTIPPVR